MEFNNMHGFEEKEEANERKTIENHNSNNNSNNTEDCTAEELLKTWRNFTFSWVIDKQLGGMAYPSEMDILALCQRNVGLIVTLTMNPLSYNINQLFSKYKSIIGNEEVPRLLHVPIPDGGTPTVQQMEEFIEEAKNTVSKGKAVVAHCARGLGRTGIILACYLVAVQDQGYRKAIQTVRKKRPGSIQNEQQEEAVQDFAIHLESNRQ